MLPNSTLELTALRAAAQRDRRWADRDLRVAELALALVWSVDLQMFGQRPVSDLRGGIHRCRPFIRPGDRATTSRLGSVGLLGGGLLLVGVGVISVACDSATPKILELAIVVAGIGCALYGAYRCWMHVRLGGEMRRAMSEWSDIERALLPLVMSGRRREAFQWLVARGYLRRGVRQAVLQLVNQAAEEQRELVARESRPN
jgi:hypothetical protein